MACLQDLSQARARWGEVAEGFFSIFNTKVIFPGIGDHRTLQLISALAGDEQVPVQTISSWAGEWGRTRHSVSVAPQFRPRLPIDQVARGVPGYTLNLSAAGMHRAAHIPWFEHRWWRPLVGSATRCSASAPVRACRSGTPTSNESTRRSVVAQGSPGLTASTAERCRTRLRRDWKVELPEPIVAGDGAQSLADRARGPARGRRPGPAASTARVTTEATATSMSETKNSENTQA